LNPLSRGEREIAGRTTIFTVPTLHATIYFFLYNGIGFEMLEVAIGVCVDKHTGI
jgi:hypothetical protein